MGQILPQDAAAHGSALPERLAAVLAPEATDRAPEAATLAPEAATEHEPPTGRAPAGRAPNRAPCAAIIATWASRRAGSG